MFEDSSADAMLAAAKSVAECVRATIEYEIAHGKDMGVHGAGYMATCGDIIDWLSDNDHMHALYATYLEIELKK